MSVFPIPCKHKYRIYRIILWFINNSHSILSEVDVCAWGPLQKQPSHNIYLFIMIVWLLSLVEVDFQISAFLSLFILFFFYVANHFLWESWAIASEWEKNIKIIIYKTTVIVIPFVRNIIGANKSAIFQTNNKTDSTPFNLFSFLILIFLSLFLCFVIQYHHFGFIAVVVRRTLEERDGKQMRVGVSVEH